MSPLASPVREGLVSHLPNVGLLETALVAASTAWTEWKLRSWGKMVVFNPDEPAVRDVPQRFGLPAAESLEHITMSELLKYV